MSILHKECLATDLALTASRTVIAATFVDNTATPHVSGAAIPTVGQVTTLLATKADLVSGKVPASQLPSYVDDVEEYANFAALPAAGETGKLYVTLDNEKVYRWTGTIYTEVSASATLASLDESVSLTTTTTSINYVGTGVTATNSGGAVTVTIPKFSAWAWAAAGDGSATVTFSDGTTLAVAAMPAPTC
jgi:hypothetical protein